MTKMKDDVYVVADLFCGAGGTSTGVVEAAREVGRRVKLIAVNHSPVAIATHQLNHPTADHYTADINVADPEALVPGGTLDVLVASPECRHFSRARGGKPLSDQSRMNPWAVHTWLTTLDVKRALIENVPEFVSWGPLNDERRPDPDRKGLYFEEWVRSLWGLGYDVEWRTLNAADYGEATSRVRFFLQARKDGKPIRWPEPTHSKDGGGMLDDLPRWRGAREVIDWSNPGRSLLDDPKYKKRPLSVKTRLRIARGIQRFCGPLAPFYTRLLDIPDDLLPAAKAKDDESGEITAFQGSNRQNAAPRSVADPIPTITTWANGGCYLVEPIAKPFLLSQQSGGAPRSVENPVPTIAAAGAISFVRPIVSEYYGNGGCRSVDEPLSTVTTKARHGLAQPMLIRVLRSDDEGAGENEQACIVPNFGENAGQLPRVHDVNRPMPTVTSRGAGNLVSPGMSEVEVKDAGEIDPNRLVSIGGELYKLDIRYRMLQNPELAKAMGFTTDEREYEFVGTIREVTKQIGNAVPVRVATALARAMLSSAASEREEGVMA